MAQEMKGAIRSWFADLLNPTDAGALRNVRNHLPELAREGPKVIPGGPIIFSSTSTGS